MEFNVLATISDAVKEYAANVGAERPLVQWILSDYDTWERNPYYVGPDQGHPDDEPSCTVWATFKEAAAEAKRVAMHSGFNTKVSNYNNRCWVVYY